MNAGTVSPRWVVAGLVLLLGSVLVGVLLTDPQSLPTLAVIAMILGLFSVPLLLRWNHLLLLLTWNMSVTVFFLPGQPPLWLIMTALVFGIGILQRTLTRGGTWHVEWSIARPLILLAVVIVITIALRGGIGMRVFGSETIGGRRYVFLLGAILGFFAMSHRAVAKEQAAWVGSLYFLSAVTAVGSTIVFFAGEQFFWLYSIFAPELSQHLFMMQSPGFSTGFQRFGGVAFGGLAVAWFVLSRFRMSELVNPRHWWAAALLLLGIVASLFGGFRSMLITLALVLVLLFILQKAYRTWLLPAALMTAVLAFAGLLLFSSHLPLAVQRAVCILPVEVDSGVRVDAENSLEWRLSMWRVLMQEVPDYLWLGKGLAIGPAELYLVEESVRRGLAASFEQALVAGEYHSGIFTLLIAFGLPGTGLFIWFIVASLKLLIRNYRSSPPELQLLNGFILAFFLTRLLSYLTIYGQFYADLCQFTGLVGLSIAVNRTSLAPQKEERPEAVASTLDDASLAPLAAPR